MPLLATEANKLTNDSLSKGVVETLITRGAKDIVQKLPFKSFQGSAFSFNREKSIPDTPSLQDAYADLIPGGVGSYQRISVEAGMLVRNADTVVLDTLGKSDINELRTQDLIRSSKKFSDDFLEQMVYGRHDDVNGGDLNLKGIEHWLSLNEADFPEQAIYNTTAGTPEDYANAQPLSLNLLDDLLSRYKGEPFDMILSDRATMVAFKDLLNAAGGNRGSDFQSKNFGGAAWAYNGTPWHVFDKVGSSRQTTPTVFGTATPAATASAAGGSVVVAEPRFAFNKRDIGRPVSVGGVPQGVITVIGAGVSTVSVSAAADATGAVVVGAAPVIYAIRMDEVDGFCAIYHSQNGVPTNPGKYHGPISGFKAHDLKRLEGSEKFRTRIVWYGNFVCQGAQAIAAASHFTR